ncbi:MAG: phage tail spike protein [Butyricicoccus sp.]
MILYFADRKLDILGQASTGLPEGLTISEDRKTEELATGVAVFECKLMADASTMQAVERNAEVGNFLLRSDGTENEFYTIIDSEEDSSSRTIYIYCEDAGIDLLNEVVGDYEADQEYSAADYVNKYIANTGFEIGINESYGTKKLEWGEEQTVTERLLDIASEFSCEISYSFDVEGMKVTHRYVNLHSKRGESEGEKLRLGRELSRIVVKKSIAETATALYVTGATKDGESKPINLSGLTYDDGDIYIDGNYHLKSRNALAKWSRYEWSTGTAGHIVKRFNYDTKNQERLLKKAVEKLKEISDVSVVYEVDINYLPPNVGVGDTVTIMDEYRGLAESVRIIKLEKSVVDQTYKADLE